MFKRGHVWWTCIRYKGRKIQKSLESSNRKFAQKIEAKIRTEIVEGTYFGKRVGENKTVKDMIDRFIEEHTPKVSENTRICYSTSFKHILPFFSKFTLTETTPKIITQYKIMRRNEGASPGSVNMELSVLSKAF